MVLIATEMFNNALKKAKRIAMLSQFQCDTELFLDIVIDEVSLLFRTEQELDAFVFWATEMKGMTHSNSVRDRCVATQGQSIGELYDVRFEFLHMPGIAWRIEAMCVVSGNAPLHRIHLERYGTGTPVHASFKLNNADTYKQMVERLAGYGPGLVPIVEYQNSYGRYCYFGGSDVDRWYLKPRVNLRDPVTTSSP